MTICVRIRLIPFWVQVKVGSWSKSVVPREKAFRLEAKVSPDKRLVERDQRSLKKLESFFGNLSLTAITRSKVMEYKAKRSQEPIIRRGKMVEGSKIAFPTQSTGNWLFSDPCRIWP